MSVDEILVKLLMDDEGKSLTLYKCPSNFWTIGVGRNLQIKGIGEDECSLMLANDIKTAKLQAQGFYWFQGLDDARKVVILSMLFNMGKTHFLEFKRMIVKIAGRDYSDAADEMLSSAWAGQVKGRARKLASIMKTGQI